MTFPRRGFLQLAGGAVALAAFAPVASAQTYPSRPVTMIVPFPAAGPADVLARILAERTLPRADSVKTFYVLLADHLHNETERSRFLREAGFPE